MCEVLFWFHSLIIVVIIVSKNKPKNNERMCQIYKLSTSNWNEEQIVNVWNEWTLSYI